MVIDENDALQVFNGIDSMPEDMRPRAASLLADYKAQQEALGAPLWPTQDKARRDRRNRVHEIFNNPLILDSENGAFIEANKAKPGFGDKLRAREASVLYLADRYGADETDVRNRFDFYKADASQQWGAGALDDSAFFAKAKSEIEVQKTKAETLKSASAAAFESALRDGVDLLDFSAWQLENEHLPEAFGDARKVWEKTREDVEKTLGADGRAAASRAFRAMRAMTGVSQESDAWINEAKNDLINLRVRSPKAYKLALAAVQVMAADAGKVEKGVVQGMGENVGRMTSDLASSFLFARPLVEMSQDVSESMVKAGITNAENPEQLAAQIRARREVENDIRDISRGVIDPVKSQREGWVEYAENAAYVTASSLPIMASVMIPGGTSTAAGLFTSISYNEFRRNGWEGPDAAAASVASGVFQAIVERASEVIIKIPGVAGVLNKFGVKPGSSWATQFFLRAGMRSGVEVSEEVIQEATTPFIQELANAVMPSIPDTPEGKHLSDVMSSFFEADNFVPLLLSVIPLGLIGAGMSTSRDMDVMEDARRFFGDQAATEIMAESDPAKRDAMIREKFNALSAADIARLARDGMNQSTVSAEAQRRFRQDLSAEAARTGITMYRDGEGWKVQTLSGSVINVDSEEAAARYVTDLRLSGEAYEADSMIALADDLVQAFPGTRLELSPSQLSADKENGLVLYNPVTDQKTVIKDAKALENLWKEASAISFDSGNAPQYVLGQNFTQFGQSIARVFRAKGGGINSVPQAITAMHEVIEAAWKKGLADGAWSVESTRQIIATLVPTLEAGIAKLGKKAQAQELLWLENAKKAAAEGNEDLIREVFSEMAVRTWIGRDSDGNKTGLRPGTILRALEGAVLQEKSPENVTTYQRLRAWFKAVGAYLKGVVATAKIIRDAERNGTIDDFTGFLDKVLGIETATREENEVKDGVIDMAFSLAPEMQSRAKPQTIAPVTEMPDGFRIVGPSTFSIQAYQGTPYTFKPETKYKLTDGREVWLVDGEETPPQGAVEIGKAPAGRIRLSKVGTGEGVQAFGWGGYAAESREVAEGYRSALTNRKKDVFLDGKLVDKKSLTNEEFKAVNMIELFGSAKAAIEAAANPDDAKFIKENAGRIEIKDRGNIYTVELLPDADEFLDWDKPLSEQSEKVRAAVAPYLAKIKGAIDGDRIYSVFLALSNTAQEASQKLASLGIPGIRYLDGGSRGAVEGTRNYVIFDENLVRILEENGNPVGSTFSLAPTGQDRGGLSNDEFNQLSEKEQDSILRSADVGKARAILLKGLDFPQNNQYTRLTFEDEPSKSSKSDSLYYFVRAWLTDAETDRLFKKDADGFLEYDYQLEEAGYQIDDDGVYKGLEIRISDHPATASARTDADIELIVDDGRASRPSWYQKHPDAYRSFAAAASDIPRKAVEKLGVKNVTFSLSPQSGIDIVSDTLESWQDVFDKAAKRNPTRAMAIRDLAQQRINRLGEMWAADRWTANGDKIRAVVEKRTKGSLDDEQAMREALRYQELLDAGMDTLTPETLMAYSEGVGTLEDDPLVKKMLHENGRLMSWATASRQNRDIKDQYNDAPWIPPQWYSGGKTVSTAIVTFEDGSMGSYDAAKVPAEVKASIAQGKATVKINKTRTPPTGGIMPDVMANNLGFDTASEMWAALESSIKSHRSAKEGYAKAEAAVKAVEKQAREQAKAEAAEWRQEADDMQADDWSPRESLVRDMRVLNVALSAFPPEVRAKVTGGSMVKLAGLATERARYKAIQKALEKAIVETEVFMRKEYTGMLIKTLDKAAPIGKPGEVKKSKFIVTVQDEIDAINDMVGMDHDDVATAIAAAEAAIITAQTPEDADAKLTELNLLELFGGILDIKNTSSQEMASALEYLENIISQGRDARKIIDEARRERVKDMVNNAKREAYKGDSGPETTQAARATSAKKSGKAMLKKFFNELSGFDAVLRDAFGPKSKTATEFSERFTLNSNRFEDVQNERRKRFRDFARELYRTKLGAKINQKLITLERIENASGVTYLKNRTVKTHKFTEEETARIVADPKAFGFTEKDAAAISEEIQAIQETGGRRKVFTYEQVENEGDRTEIPLSQMDALYLSMALRQPGILEQQQRYGYDQETVDQLEKFLTDDAKRWRSWMQMEYDAGYNSANEVYMRMFNTRMPKITFYAPLMKNHQGQQAVLDPLNTGISSNSANPGSIKTRKARTSSLRIESAFSVFWSHFNQMEYWNANAEYLRDVQSVMLNPEVREAVVSAHGEDGMATISAWVQLQMSRGVGKAALAIAGSKMFRNVKSAISMKALALNLSTTLKTIPSVFYSLGEIHMSKWPAALVSGMKHWDRLWKTNIIQRRLDIGGMPELRDLGSSALPMSWVNQGIRYGSHPTMYADGVFTTYSAAMAYGTSFDEAKRQDASDAMAHKYAEERTALIVSKTAQPENWTQKSLFENDASGAGSLFFMFTSDPRQKLALAGEALNQWRKGSATTEEAMRKFLAYWVIPGIMFQLANAIGRSVFKGDDDEWEVVDFATAALVGQFQGLALLGSAAEIIVAAAIAGAAEKITGEQVKKKPIWNSPKNPLDQAAQELVKSVGKITEEDVKDGPGKAWEITKSAGMLLAPLTPAGAIPSTAERVMKDTTNLFYGADEK